MHVAASSTTSNHYYAILANSHRQLALQKALSPLSRISPANCHALFAFAGVIALSAFASPTDSGPNATASPVDKILEFFPLIRGIQTVIRSALPWIAEGSMNPMMNRQWDRLKFEPESMPSNLSPIVGAQLHALQELNRRSMPKNDEAACFANAIDRLVSIFETYKIIAEDRSLVFVWTVSISDEFVLALQCRKPMALVILAHYAILLHSVNERWWARERGAELIRAIHQELPQEWKSAVAWPMQVIESDNLMLGDGVRGELSGRHNLQRLDLYSQLRAS